MLRTSLAVSSLILGASFMLGCDPANRSGEPTVPVSATGELPSCCQDPTPSIADARKAALNKTADAKLPTEPTILGSPEAEKAKADAAAATATKLDEAQPATVKPGDLAAPAERSKLGLDFTMTDQESQPFVLKSILGKPTVATFIFTRCGDPNMCPLQGVKMANLQKQLEKAGLSDKVNLLVFTFDPAYDTPERLKEWGKTQGIALTNANAKLLRPDPREFSDFQYEFQFRAGAVEGQITHKTDMMLIDHEGKVAAFYHGMWKDDEALAKVKELIAAVK